MVTGSLLSVYQLSVNSFTLTKLLEAGNLIIPLSPVRYLLWVDPEFSLLFSLTQEAITFSRLADVLRAKKCLFFLRGFQLSL